MNNMKDFSDESDECDDLPCISLNTSNSSQFEMPDADVLASQRLQEAKQEVEIERMKCESVAGIVVDESGSDGELSNLLDTLQVEPPASTTVQFENPGNIPTIQSLISLLTEQQYQYLSCFIDCLKSNDTVDLDEVVKDILAASENVMFRDNNFDTEDILCLGITYSLICITHVCRSAAQSRLPRVRLALYYLVDNIITDSTQVRELGVALMKIVPDFQDRFELATVLEGGGTHSSALAEGIVRTSLLQMLTDEYRQEWVTTPLTPSELLSLLMKSWRELSTKQQLMVAQYISKSLTQMQSLPELPCQAIENYTEEESGRKELACTELFNYLSNNISNGYKDHKIPEKLRLQVLVARMQLLHRSSHSNRGYLPV